LANKLRVFSTIVKPLTKKEFGAIERANQFIKERAKVPAFSRHRIIIQTNLIFRQVGRQRKFERR